MNVYVLPKIVFFFVISVFLTEFRLGLSHLWEHEFKHNFQDTRNPICYYGEDIGNSCHFLLHCSLNAHNRLVFLRGFWGIDNSILELRDCHFVKVLFLGKKFLDNRLFSFLICFILCFFIYFILLPDKLNR